MEDPFAVAVGTGPWVVREEADDTKARHQTQTGCCANIAGRGRSRCALARVRRTLKPDVWFQKKTREILVLFLNSSRKPYGKYIQIMECYKNAMFGKKIEFAIVFYTVYGAEFCDKDFFPRLRGK